MKLDIKKLFFIAAITITACVIASVAIEAITTEPEKPAQSTTVTQEEHPDTYILTQKHGRIVAYIKGVEIPYIETTTAVNSLPYDVQEKLKKGIEFDSLESLKAVMNEYCS